MVEDCSYGWVEAVCTSLGGGEGLCIFIKTELEMLKWK